MTVSSRSTSSGVSSGRSNTLDKSRMDTLEETAEPMHLQSLVRLELSNGQHIYSKLVVIINPSSPDSWFSLPVVFVL